MKLVVNQNVGAGGIRETLNRNVLPGLGRGSRVRHRSRRGSNRGRNAPAAREGSSVWEWEAQRPPVRAPPPAGAAWWVQAPLPEPPPEWAAPGAPATSTLTS